ncbi:MAG TPA: right-handed parallel beta-helix repeat-containing protein [bacterium]
MLQGLGYRLPLTLLLAVLSIPAPARGATLAVCPVGCAYGSIQAAIDASAASDEIVVGDGAYFEHITFPAFDVVLRSENGPGRTVIDGSAKLGSVVTVEGGQTPAAVLQGFTITGGDTPIVGGGIAVNVSSPTIRECWVLDNSAGGPGGGIHLSNSNSAVVDCVIMRNHTGYAGGGVFVAGGSPSLTRCTISDNLADSYGGGTYLAATSCSVIDSSIVGNRAVSQHGGGAYMSGGAVTVAGSRFSGNFAGNLGGGVEVDSGIFSFSRCTIDNNRSTIDGGGLFSSVATVSLQGCVVEKNAAGGSGGGLDFSGGSTGNLSATLVRGNLAAVYGGGVRCEGDSSPRFINSIFSGNTAGVGGGVSVTGAAPGSALTNCTVAGNNATASGGGVMIESAPLPLTSSVVWGNTAFADPQISVVGAIDPPVTLTRCDVEGGWGGAGTGNIAAFPRFLLPLAAASAPTAGGDYRLQSTSPCVNTGETAGAPATDFEGDARPQRGAVDIGADEVGWLPNGYLEGGNKLPTGWTGVGLGLNDQRVTDVVHDGLSAFRFAGNALVDKMLVQARAVSGAAGKYLVLRGWNRTAGVSASGGTIGMELKVTFEDGSVRSWWATFARTTHGWTAISRAFRMPKSFTKAQVLLHFTRQKGSAWFDGVELLVR